MAACSSWATFHHFETTRPCRYSTMDHLPEAHHVVAARDKPPYPTYSPHRRSRRSSDAVCAHAELDPTPLPSRRCTGQSSPLPGRSPPRFWCWYGRLPEPARGAHLDAQEGHVRQRRHAERYCRSRPSADSRSPRAPAGLRDLQRSTTRPRLRTTLPPAGAWTAFEAECTGCRPGCGRVSATHSGDHVDSRDRGRQGEDPDDRTGRCGCPSCRPAASRGSHDAGDGVHHRPWLTCSERPGTRWSLIPWSRPAQPLDGAALDLERLDEFACLFLGAHRVARIRPRSDQC